MGEGIREIARTTGVPKSTVGDLKKRVAADGDAAEPTDAQDSITKVG
jgi:phage portal protein BeeE